MADSKLAAMTEIKPSAATDRVTINVSGRRYETYDAVLRRLPQSLLGDEQRRAAFWDPARGEFFFDRCASSFEGILLAYQVDGEAWRPCGVPHGIFVEDLKFFGLTKPAAQLASGGSGGGGDSAAPPAQHLLQSVSQMAGWRGRVPPLLKQPLWVAASQLVTLVAVVAYVVSTLPSLQPGYKEPDMPWLQDDFKAKEVGVTWLVSLLVLEFFCMLLVSFELVFRFLDAGARFRFFRDPMNVLDLAMTAPFFLFFLIVLCIGLADLAGDYKALFWMINLIRLLRLFRIFRVLRETKTVQTLKRAVVAAAPAIGVIAVIWMVAAMAFASLLSWAEWDTHLALTSIPRAIYWAIITMTTVGYGDLRTGTTAGRFISALCAYTGYIMAALPVAVLVTKLAQCSRESGQDEAEAQSKVRVWQGASRPDTHSQGIEMVTPTRDYGALPTEDGP